MVIAGNLLLAAALLYLAVGFAVGLRFAIVDATAFSERAAVGSFPFRVLLVPGAALLWPLVLRTGKAGVTPRPPHGAEPVRVNAGQRPTSTRHGQADAPLTAGEEGMIR